MAQQTFYETGAVKIGDMNLESGKMLSEVEMAFERAGPKDAPVILVCHALTGNQYTVGNHEQKGWWKGLIFDGGYVDTNQYQVLTFNVLGGCDGSTGPTSINPITGQSYNGKFPFITVKDMVKAQYLALEKLDIHHLKAVIGGSLGGMQVLEWGIQFPQAVEVLFPLAVTPSLSDFGIAFNHISRTAILNDPNWNDGHYSREQIPDKGLALARMIGMLTYRTDSLFGERFHRSECLRDGERHHKPSFEIESYLNYQGEKLTSRFDANSYLYLLKAMDLHDIGKGRAGWNGAIKEINAQIVAIGFSNDLVYPPEKLQHFVIACENHDKSADYFEVETQFGHDGFLVEFEKWGYIIRNKLTQLELISSNASEMRALEN
ncbi:homoserine O-acetyltransferase [Alkalihalobacillus sp. AL-G]|uniref:homoserine O-acetyltransferase MetX n=1 Tax=Alkalihalobacillus sp. AL-G TaxID=2926399 RepID=UPI00272B2F55|nr:homoserine O-acetyltransferase [Alkalihalobacillus sp. AL-G]WLD94725.1 homoserine O-acetyltransferase [Alkalihalobacillus sp. AL-G]